MMFDLLRSAFVLHAGCYRAFSTTLSVVIPSHLKEYMIVSNEWVEQVPQLHVEQIPSLCIQLKTGWVLYSVWVFY